MKFLRVALCLTAPFLMCGCLVTLAYENEDGHRFEVGVDTGKRVARTQKPSSK